MLLEINNLKISFYTDKGILHAVDGTDFSIAQGQTFVLLGESGCGKTLTSLAIPQLLPDTAIIDSRSRIQLNNKNLLNYSEVQLRKIRGKKIGFIFQEPMTSLNPVLTIGQQIGEVLSHHLSLSFSAKQNYAIKLLNDVGIHQAHQCIQHYPHQLSGGMKQRVMIAMALAAYPELLIADEPTTALDVTTQAQILKLMNELQAKANTTILLITHDLGVAKAMADQVAVMYAGHIVEQAEAKQLFAHPLHPYTQKLFDSIPTHAKHQQRLNTIKGSVPPLTHVFSGCRFVDRCPYAWSHCETHAPNLLTVDQTQVRCHLYDKTLNHAANHAQRDNQQAKAISQPSTRHPSPSPETTPLLEVNNLHVHFPIRRGLFKRTVGYVKAVNGISFTLKAGETLALVGESGCGKTTTGRGIIQLIPITQGHIHYKQQSLAHMSTKHLRALRHELQIIFQDPYSSLNPRMLINDILMEGVVAQNKSIKYNDRITQAKHLLNLVGLPEGSLDRYPHEFSGGQRQRLSIARALAVKPQLIICDEPTSALDMPVQAQILNLLKQLQQELSLAYLFITHNLGVVGYLADQVAVMYQGKIVEHGTTSQILHKPQHRYTQELLDAVIL